MEFLTSLSWVDVFILAVLALFMLIGLGRGVVRTIVSLISWLLAFYFAYTLAASLGLYLKPYVLDAEIRLWTARIVIFILIMIAGALIGNTLGNIVSKGKAKGLDRFFGLLLGFALGSLILATALLLSGLTNFPETPMFKQSEFVPYFMDIATWMKGFLPIEWQNKINLTPVRV